VSNLLTGQDVLSTGYQLLEAQEYTKAESFFQSHLDTKNKTARICHARAVGLGGKVESALDLFIELKADYSDDFEIQLNLAEAYLWNNKPQEAKIVYNALLSQEPENFVANLGYANAHAALRDHDTALHYIEKALIAQPLNAGAHNSKKHIMIAKAYALYKNGAYDTASHWLAKVEQIEPGNENAIDIRQQIEQKLRTVVTAQYSSSADAGGNRSLVKQLDASFNLTNRHRLSVMAQLIEGYYKNEKAARQQSIFISDQYLLNKTISLQLGTGVSASKSGDMDLNRALVKGGIELFLSERWYSKAEYTSEVHNYSVDLIKSDILMRHYSMANNYQLTKKLGFYVNGVYSTQSDNNSRKLFYSSLYYSLVDSPLVRLGVNYNYFEFEEQRENYFSPESYQLGECFMLIDNGQSASKLKYKLQVSFGAQKVENQSYQAISRIEAKTRYDFANGLSVSVKYLTNSAAAATAIGEYIYNEWSVSLSHQF